MAWIIIVLCIAVLLFVKWRLLDRETLKNMKLLGAAAAIVLLAVILLGVAIVSR